MEYYSCRVKNALYHHGRKDLPYATDLNPYKGCSHGCLYCYARARAEKRGSDFGRIGIKENISDILEKEFRGSTYKGGIINIGGSTDSYQNIEKETALMREILKIMIKFNIPVIISTKSKLILRDIDLIRELSRKAYVNIAFSISTTDTEHSGIFENGTPPPADRFETIKEFSKEGINSALHFFPVIPFVSDTETEIERMCKYAFDAACTYMMCGFLYLPGDIGRVFFPSLEKRDRALSDKIRSVYTGGKASTDIKKRFYTIMKKYTGKYRLETNYRKFIPSSLLKTGNENNNQLYLDF